MIDLEKIKEKVQNTGKKAADKAKWLEQIANLKSQVATCEDIEKKNYMETGRLYYEKMGENPDLFLEKQCRSIKNARHGAEELKKKLEEIKRLSR